MAETSWWEKRWFLALVVLASTIPLLLPETPPLVDVPGHMGRFRVQLDLANSPELQRYFEFHWALIGNLGVDLLIVPLAPIFGLEGTVKLIALTIPPISAIGIFWIAKEVHGRIQPTAMFALPFIYGFPFNFGFLNFSLSVALALCASGLWLWVTKRSLWKLRALVFIPIGALLWIVHVYGWCILGLFALTAELVRRRDEGAAWRNTFFRAAVATAPLALPLIMMILWRSAWGSGDTQFFALSSKLYALFAVLRDRWLIWDSFGVGAALLLIGAARFEQDFRFSRQLVIPASILAIIFVFLPSMLFGSSFADIRLVPLVFITAILAIQVDEQARVKARRVAWVSLAFVSFRLVGNTISFGIADREVRTWLTALDHIPNGAPVLFLVSEFCSQRWEMQRHAHIGSFVITRRNGFANNQWDAAGAQLLRVNYTAAGKFRTHRSTITVSTKCHARIARATGEIQFTDQLTSRVLERFPREAFDYVWIIQPGEFEQLSPRGLTPIWSRKDAVLYRIEH